MNRITKPNNDYSQMDDRTKWELIIDDIATLHPSNPFFFSMSVFLWYAEKVAEYQGMEQDAYQEFVVDLYDLISDVFGEEWDE